MLSFGRTSPDFKVQKSLGNTPFTTLFAITGNISNLSTAFKLVTPDPLIAVLPHGQLNTPDYVYFASTSNSDSITGIGARVMLVFGLDEFYNVYEEIVLLNGQTPVISRNKFAKVFELLVLELGSNVNVYGDSACVGNIYCGTGTFTAGIPANPIVSILAASDNLNSRTAIFTVPAGKILLMKSIFVTTTPDKKENTSAIVQVATRVFGFGQNFWLKTLPYDFDGIYNNVFEFNSVFPPLADIQIRAQSQLEITKPTTVEIACELRDLR